MSLEQARQALIRRFILEVIDEINEPVEEERLLKEVNKKLALWREENVIHRN